jgi:5-methylcytosine-specific restriction endonuclease McrA
MPDDLAVALFCSKPNSFAKLKLMRTCVNCGAVEGTPGVAFDRDHKTPLTDGGLNDPSNEQDLCVPCHRDKTADENSQRVPEDIDDWVANKLNGLLQNP